MMKASLNEYLKKYRAATTVKEKYLLEREAYENLDEPDGDKFFETLCDMKDLPKVQSVHMGLNTRKRDPEWENLKSQIRDIVEVDGIAKISWECTGRTLHYNLAIMLREDMEDYDFDIEYEHYKCMVTKK